MDKNGQKPFLNGVNHLVWQDGEPIDPFIIAVLAGQQNEDGTGARPHLVFQREVYNRGHAFLEMSPLQRLLSARQPCGFDSNLANIPQWAFTRLTPDARQFLDSPTAFLGARATALVETLNEALGVGHDAPKVIDTQPAVDQVVSLAERLSLVSMPSATTIGWLQILLHYGHTVSGAVQAAGGDNPILTAFTDRTGLALAPTTGVKRDDPNGRWLIAYTKGIMDTDALSDFVFGELYVPLTVQNPTKTVELGFAWQFPAAMQRAVADYACLFDRPFWSEFQVDGGTRIRPLPNGGAVIEVLTPPSSPAEYRYTATGLPGITAYEGSFHLTAAEADDDDDASMTLSWSLAFSADSPAGAVRALSDAAAAAAAMTSAMEAHFGPRRTSSL